MLKDPLKIRSPNRNHYGTRSQVFNFQHSLNYVKIEKKTSLATAIEHLCRRTQLLGFLTRFAGKPSFPLPMGYSSEY